MANNVSPKKKAAIANTGFEPFFEGLVTSLLRSDAVIGILDREASIISSFAEAVESRPSINAGQLFTAERFIEGVSR